MKIRMQHGFHFGAGHNELGGWGEWWREQNNDGIPVNAIGADNAGPLWEIQNGGYADNILIWRRSLWDGGFDPNSPDYNAEPGAEAVRMLAYKYDNLWPPELHKLFCFLKNCNEIRTHTGEGDTWYDDLEPGQWWGRYALAAAKFATERDYRVVLLSPSSADHDYDFWMQPAMLGFLRYAADHKSNVMVGLHEYSYVARNLFAMIGDDDATVEDVLATQPDDYWKLKVGRFRMLFEACDRAGIGDWPMLYFPEWGWALDSIPSTGAALEQIVAAHTQIYGPYYRYIAGMGTWYLGPGYGGNIARNTNALMLPCAAFAIENEIEVKPAFPADGTPPDPDPDPPTPSEKLAWVNFTGWGLGDDQLPVGWRDSDECPYIQVPYAISGDDSLPSDRLPMRYEGWEGDNPYNPDGKVWNDYACPEAVIMWDAMLPPHEHYYLNEFGRCQHWFVPQKAGRSRFYTSAYLQPGTYRLTLDFYGDFSKIVDGKKIPQPDPKHGQVELFLGAMGKDEMLDINLLGPNSISREFSIHVAGDYVVGYGILSRYAAGSNGTAGVFLQGFAVTAVEEDIPPVDPPDDECGKTTTIRRTVHLLPQDITLEEEHKIVTDFHAAKNSFVYSHDDAIVIQLAGDPERSLVYVWEPERRNPADLEVMDACGVRWEARHFDTQPPAPGNPLTRLKLGYLFRYQYSNDYYGGRFNDPRNYGNGLHEGVDADVIGGQADNKTAVLCTYDGIVDRSLDSTGGYGKYVRVQHENNGSVFYTRYCHLDARYVGVGDMLHAGDEVGEVGTTGNVTGEHVHVNLEVPGYGLSGYVVADVVDPTPYLPQDGMSLPPLGTLPPTKRDLRPYFTGDNTQYQRLFEVETRVHGVGVGQQRHQLQIQHGRSYFAKGGDGAAAPSEWEELLVADGKIKRWRDYSFSGTDWYQIGDTFVDWMREFMAEGEVVVSSAVIKHFSKADCRKWSGPTPTTDYLKFVAHHASWDCYNGITLSDVIEVHWSKTPGFEQVEETYFFSADPRASGLVGWRNERDGRDARVSELHDPGARQNSVLGTPDCMSNKPMEEW